MAFMPVLNQIIALFLILFLGYYLRRRGTIGSDELDFLFGLLLDYILPFMIISAMIVDIEPGFLENVIYLLLAWGGVYLLVIAVARLAAHQLPGSARHRRTLEFLIIFSNVGYMGLPVLGAIFPEYGIFYGAIGQIPFNVIIWTYGIYLLQENKEGLEARNLLHIFQNNGTLALGIGFFFLLTGLNPPVAVTEAINLIGDATFPISMLVIGASLYGMDLREIVIKPQLLGLSFFKLLLLPASVLLLLSLTPLPGILAGVITVQIGMPVAANSVIFSARFPGDEQLASEGVFLTTSLALFTIPLITALVTLMV